MKIKLTLGERLLPFIILSLGTILLLSTKSMAYTLDIHPINTTYERNHYIHGYKIDKRVKKLDLLAECDKIIYYPEQARCYNYKVKGPLFNVYFIDEKINELNIRKRMRFMLDPNLSPSAQTPFWCFKYGKKDKGHLFPDADADYNYSVLKTTYYLSNVVPQTSYINRKVIAKLEALERGIATYTPILVITGAHYYKDKYLDNNHKCMKLPKYYYKVFIARNVGGRFYPFMAFVVSASNGKVKTLTNQKEIYSLLRKENIILINR